MCVCALACVQPCTHTRACVYACANACAGVVCVVFAEGGGDLEAGRVRRPNTGKPDAKRVLGVSVSDLGMQFHMHIYTYVACITDTRQHIFIYFDRKIKRVRGSYRKPGSWANCDEFAPPYRGKNWYGGANSSQLAQLPGFLYDPRTLLSYDQLLDIVCKSHTHSLSLSLTPSCIHTHTHKHTHTRTRTRTHTHAYSLHVGSIQRCCCASSKSRLVCVLPGCE